jgi:hypothetical protein
MPAGRPILDHPTQAASDGLPDASPVKVMDGDVVLDGWEMDYVVEAAESPGGADVIDAVTLDGQIVEAEAVAFDPCDEILDAVYRP